MPSSRPWRSFSISLFYLVYFFDINTHLKRPLFGQRVTAEILGKAARHLLVLCYRLDHMHGDTNSTALVGERAGYRLAYPPCRIGREFKSFGKVKLVHGLKESEIP